jgi:hypothetical protein
MDGRSNSTSAVPTQDMLLLLLNTGISSSSSSSNP